MSCTRTALVLALALCALPSVARAQRFETHCPPCANNSRAWVRQLAEPHVFPDEDACGSYRRQMVAQDWVMSPCNPVDGDDSQLYSGRRMTHNPVKWAVMGAVYGGALAGLAQSLSGKKGGTSVAAATLAGAAGGAVIFGGLSLAMSKDESVPPLWAGPWRPRFRVGLRVPLSFGAGPNR